MVSAICFCPSEAKEILVAETYLNEWDTAGESRESEGHAEEQEFQAIQDQLNASIVERHENEDHDEKPLSWGEETHDYAKVYFVRKGATKCGVREYECRMM